MKTLTTISLFLLTSLTVLTSCAQTSTPEDKSTSKVIMKDLDIISFKEAIESKPGIIILDVRTGEELNSGKIKNSINIDFYNDFREKILTLNKSTPTYIYCASGGRSSKAMDILHREGFQELYNLKGGFNKWSQNNFATVK